MQLTFFLVQTPWVKAIFLAMKAKTLSPCIWVTPAHYSCIDHWLRWCVYHGKKSFVFIVLSLGSPGFQVACHFWLSIDSFAQKNVHFVDKQQNAECLFWALKELVKFFIFCGSAEVIYCVDIKSYGTETCIKSTNNDNMLHVIWLSQAS